MSEQITLKNEILEVKINTLGAELQSVKTPDGAECIWDGNPAYWSGQCPVLFPIAGGLKEDQYLFEGTEYTLKKHGFTRESEFKVESATDTKAVFLLEDSKETLQCYPFAFAFRVIYTLLGNCLHIDYRVDNPSDAPMYFSLGAHEGYCCPEGIEEYSVIFDEKETLNASRLYGNLLGEDGDPVITDTRELALKSDYFKVDALVFPSVKSNAVTLLHRKSGRRIRVEFPDFPYLLLWTKVGAGYICIEPWGGLPDYVGSSYDFTQKKGINKLDGKQSRIFTHRIYF